MIKQKRNQKVTEKNKQSVNVFKLQQRVESLEKQLALQLRINANQVSFNDMRILNEAVAYENISELKSDVIALKQNIVKRAINRFWVSKKEKRGQIWLSPIFQYLRKQVKKSINKVLQTRVQK
ncbi:hypothetical protein [Pasteurella multocida]|uniref:hypothetical protein n=1 Tax=Pasteurella multocida TaxID=747 RepID=UPI003979412D